MILFILLLKLFQLWFLVAPLIDFCVPFTCSYYSGVFVIWALSYFLTLQDPPVLYISCPQFQNQTFPGALVPLTEKRSAQGMLVATVQSLTTLPNRNSIKSHICNSTFSISKKKLLK